MSLYQILYIKLYQFTLKTPSGNDLPEQIASMVLTALISFNVICTFLFIRKFQLYDSEAFFSSYTYIFLVFLVVAVINYFLFIRGKKYIMLEKDYRKVSKRRRDFHTSIVLLYIVLSAVFFMVLQ